MTETISKTKILYFENGEITVKKVSMRRLISLIDDLSKVEELSGLDNIQNDEFLATLPTRIATSFPKFANLVAKAIDNDGVDGDYLLDNLAVDEVVELIEAIIDVNNVAKIIERIKKMQTLGAK